MSDNKDIIEYYNKLAESYNENRFNNSYGRFLHHRENDILQGLLIHSSGTSVSIACGTGRFMEYVDCGLDASNAMIDQAKKNFPSKTFYVADATNTPFEDHSIDQIICFHLFMHLSTSQIVAIMKEFDRILKPAGQLIVDLPSKTRRKLRTPNEQTWHGQTALSPKWLQQLAIPYWSVVAAKGLLYVPIQRFPKTWRIRLLKLDQILARLLPVQFAQYIVYSLKRQRST